MAMGFTFSRISVALSYSKAYNYYGKCIKTVMMCRVKKNGFYKANTRGYTGPEYYWIVPNIKNVIAYKILVFEQ